MLGIGGTCSLRISHIVKGPERSYTFRMAEDSILCGTLEPRWRGLRCTQLPSRSYAAPILVRSDSWLETFDLGFQTV